MLHTSVRRHSVPIYQQLIQGMSLDELLGRYASREMDQLGITELGREATKLAAEEHLRNHTVRAKVVLHSPLARASETAQIWTEILNLPMQAENALLELRPPVEILRGAIAQHSTGSQLDIRQIMATSMQRWMDASMLEELIGNAMNAIRAHKSDCLVICHGWLMRGMYARADLGKFLSHPGFAFNQGFESIIA